MPFEREEGTFFIDVIKIALGVFIGGLLAALAYEQVLAWRMAQALKEVQAQAQRSTEQIQRSQQRAEQQRQRDSEAREQQAQQALEHARRERIRKERKSAAWERFYQPAEACKVDPGTMPCANAYMAAKKQFELQYRD
ncbi:hypothetical protein ABEW79_11030 [Delftia tsuruhatensis]|uniref:hypothetical protein n=1 Tax=Delftia tsuruhatensis TaxID=180282 RepID=UPI003D25BB9E